MSSTQEAPFAENFVTKPYSPQSPNWSVDAEGWEAFFIGKSVAIVTPAMTASPAASMETEYPVCVVDPPILVKFDPPR